MEYMTWFRKRLCIIFVIAFVLSNVLLIIIMNSLPDISISFWRALNDTLGLQSQSSELVDVGKIRHMIDDDLRYKNIIEQYNNKLNSMHPRDYSLPGTHVDIGKPLSSLRNVSGSLFSKPKLILLWTTFFGKKHWETDRAFQNCPRAASCHFTTDKEDLSRSHAVIMHPRDMPKGRRSLPAVHVPWQRWVYFIQESPWHTGVDVRDFNGVFNLTATYRRDSDIPVGYGIEIVRRKKAMDNAKLAILLSDILSSKSKLVAARISNCDTSKSERLSYIAELKKYIPVDFYGSCGNLACPLGEEGDNIMKQYKFFLAFENSNCRDYITEKFSLARYTWRSVPVVMGGASPKDYRDVAPDQAFIHTAGFESPKHLAEYLLLLDRNQHLYRQYFTWHKYWQRTSEINVEAGWCSLCSILTNLSSPTKCYRDFKGWYSEDSC